MKCPPDVYQPSPRPYTGLPNIAYPCHGKTIVVTRQEGKTAGENPHP